VICNDPLLEDGRPMPTRYWLVSKQLRQAVGRLEAAGGVREAEAAVDPKALADAHRRYAAEREAALPLSYQGSRPTGGVGGTRAGVKCLHAHLAYYLAGGDDPVGAYVARRLGADPKVSGEVVAAFDCGTNSTRVLVSAGGSLPLERRMQITRLGEGVDATGRLSEAAIGRTLDALSAYKALADQLGARRLRAVTTSATREATNADELLGPAEAMLGTPLEVLGGAEEGRLAYRGATRDLDPEIGPYLMIDLGGGSTELVAGDGFGGIAASVSLPIGCVRVTERFLAGDPPSPESLDDARRYVAGVVGAALKEHPGLRLPAATVSVAGTSAVLAALSQGLDRYERSRVHLATLTRGAIDELADRLAKATLAARRQLLAVEPARAEVIVGGALALSELLGTLGRDACVHSEADLLDGIVLDLTT
jgi:exopolyphosphatase/guanosine-5'-triphosphate,3'-diphosphate pyrophosphatase